MSSIREQLLDLDACVVSDALDALGLTGAVAGLHPVWEGSRTAGRVVTMRTVPADGRPSHRHLGTAAIERACPGEIIVVQQEHGGTPTAGAWGGLLAQAAIIKGIGGVVIDGACRDIDEVRQLGLPVSALTSIPFTARGRFVEHSVGEPLQIHGVTVADGDYVIADGSGVAFIAAADIERVLTTAGRLVAKERLMIEDLRQGLLPSVVMGRNYEEMLNAG
jgi:regulator of RNase E activity RraA